MLIREELERVIRRVCVSPEVKELYMQNPLLRFLGTASPKDLVEYRRRFLAEQRAAGNIIDDANADPSAAPDDSSPKT